jgi:acetyltransferase-like isoleucine patch superfamily enzyme
MGFLSKEELAKLEFASLGNNVLVSDRAVFYEPWNQSIGHNSRIDDFCVVSGKVSLGRNVHIAVQCNLAGGLPGIEIGDFSGLAYNCQVFSQSDDYSGASLTGPTIPSEFKKEFFKSVILGRHVIVGASSVILPGSNLNDGTACMAMTLVSGETQQWSLYGGSPARRIQNRDQGALSLEIEYISANNTSLNQ